MLASDVKSLVDSSGLKALSEVFAISRREAEHLDRRARRALLSGSNPQMVTDASGTIHKSRLAEPQEELREVDQATELEKAAQARARRIRAESYGLQLDSVGKLRGRLRILERNIAAGYLEWSDDLKLTKRTLELLGG